MAANLARVTGLPRGSPELDELVERSFESYARYWLETFRLVREGREFFLERVHCRGKDNLDGVLDRGRGAVVAVGHLGNWDAAGAWVAATGRTLVAVAEVLRPRRMFDFFVRHRSMLGMKIYPAAPGVTEQLIAEVESGSVVAILADRDLKGTGPEVEFFGETTTLPPGAASVALRAGVPLLVAGVYGVRRADGRPGWIADISEPIELPKSNSKRAVEDLTRAMGKKMEDLVAKSPEEWHVFQPFWPADRLPP